MTRRATSLAFALMALGCATGPTDDDPPDPMLPLEGTWEVVEREISRAFCDGSPSNEPVTKFIDRIFVRHLRDKMYVSYGRSHSWNATGIRCPVSASGHWLCSAVPFMDREPTRVTTYETTIAGHLIDDPQRMKVQLAREANCHGERCRREYCVIMERSTVQFIPPRIHDPD